MTLDRRAQLQALKGMDLQSLRVAWTELYGPAPRTRSVDLLRRLLAWRLQVEAAGGLSPELKAALRHPAQAHGPALPTGASVAREWRGVRHEVQILEAGALYQGRVFDSLSAVAREITGVRWNGPRFFGLRQEARGER